MLLEAGLAAFPSHINETVRACVFAEVLVGVGKGRMCMFGIRSKRFVMSDSSDLNNKCILMSWEPC